MLAQAAEIVNAVRAEGDAALRRFSEKFGGGAPDDLCVGRAEFDAAKQRLTPAQIVAIETAVANVTRFHEAQRSPTLRVETMAGVVCERISRPIGSVGLYVPAASAPLPSTAIMLAVPALVAGCPERAIACAPDAAGQVNAAVLVAARFCGIEVVYKMGGAQAIAALAFGTRTVRKVDKIFGPGSAWVTAAKQLVSNVVSIDMLAGPSELAIIADESANPDFIAADLLAQAEHDSDALPILISTSNALIDAVERAIERRLTLLPTRAIAGSSTR